MGQIDATLRLVMLAVAGIHAISWMGLGIAFRIYPKAVVSFFLANLGIGLGTALVMDRVSNPGFISFQVADWLAIGGISACRAGIAFIVREKPKLLGLIAPLALEICLTAFVAPDESSYIYRALAFNTIATAVALIAFTDCMKTPSRDQFAWPAKLIIGWPLLAAGLLFAFRALQVLMQWSDGGTTSQHQPANYTAFLWAFMVVLLTINIAMVRLVMSLLLQRISELADLDPLTECLNRRAFQRNLTSELDRLKRSDLPLACALFDLDHFKQINDTYGHSAGDRALVHAVAVVKASIRSIDVLGRYGGEEFVLLMPNTSLESATETADRVRIALAESPFKVDDRLIPLSASFGVTSLIANESAEDALRRADMAMYEAKRLGRNRVEIAQPPSA